MHIGLERVQPLLPPRAGDWARPLAQRPEDAGEAERKRGEVNIDKTQTIAEEEGPLVKRKD
jgi:hypothetical protein